MSRPKRGSALDSKRTSPLRLMLDRLGRWSVTTAGFVIIASILGILFFVLFETWPLFRSGEVQVAVVQNHPNLPAGQVITDEYMERVVHVTPSGQITLLDALSGAPLGSYELADRVAEPATQGENPQAPAERTPAEQQGTEQADTEQGDAPNALVDVLVLPDEPLVVGLTASGRVILQRIAFSTEFDEESVRTVQIDLPEPTLLQLDVAGRSPEEMPTQITGRLDSDGAATAIAINPTTARADIVARSVEEDMFSDELEETIETGSFKLPLGVSEMILGSSQVRFFVGTHRGDLHSWKLRGADVDPIDDVTVGDGVTALGLLIGDRSLIVGTRNGTSSVWYSLRDENNRESLQRIRSFRGTNSPVEQISPSGRNKGFLARHADGHVGLHYSTSHRTIWKSDEPLAKDATIRFSPRADGAWIAKTGSIQGLVIDNPHPEISASALLSKIQYENASTKEYVWQSSSGSDDFEPKLSLIPLLFGTIKGTLYSLILAIPLGVLGAMYASQFMHPSLKRIVKPTIEIMAALPSVVLGFLAGLWLAPRVEQVFPSLLLMLIFIPVSLVVVGEVWERVPKRYKLRFFPGSELAVYGLAIVFGAFLAYMMGPGFGAMAFDGSMSQWIFEVTGTPYDQRNAVVVGLAMGFAVIPIIFSVAEDSFSNVPRHLIAGSLALGASLWHTVTRVVLPTASPGIFSAIMIGFGRAIGETMIVLMATGNTPIMDWFPFNGFRTMSANIAVEIPEAPEGGTLYRTLFLAALMLFILTFLVNTVADVVGQRLRNRYANL